MIGLSFPVHILEDHYSLSLFHREDEAYSLASNNDDVPDPRAFNVQKILVRRMRLGCIRRRVGLPETFRWLPEDLGARVHAR